MSGYELQPSAGRCPLKPCARREHPEALPECRASRKMCGRRAGSFQNSREKE